MRYAQVYNTLFSKTGIHKSHKKSIGHVVATTVARMLNVKNVAERLQTTCHMKTIVHTQSMGVHMDATYIHTQQRLAYLAWIISRLRPLQRHILRHLWRPSGPMVHRDMHRTINDVNSALCGEILCAQRATFSPTGER